MTAPTPPAPTATTPCAWRRRIHDARHRLADRVHARIAGRPRTPAGPPPTRLSRALRWARRVALGIVLLLVLARLALPYALPRILARVAASKGFTCGYDRLDLGLLSGELRLVNLTLAEPESAEPVALVGYAEVDVVPLELLSGRLHARRIELSGVDVRIDREKDGRLEILKRMAAASGAPTAAPEAPEAPAPAPKPEGSGSSGGMALVLDQVTIDHIRVHLRDASVAPALDAHLLLDALISDIDTSGAARPRPGRIELLVTCRPLELP